MDSPLRVNAVTVQHDCMRLCDGFSLDERNERLVFSVGAPCEAVLQTGVAKRQELAVERQTHLLVRGANGGQSDGLFAWAKAPTEPLRIAPKPGLYREASD